LREENIIDIFKKALAILFGHFVYTSGRHGKVYVNKDALYKFTKVIKSLCYLIAERFVDDGIEVVIGPAVGGVVLSQWIADALQDLTGKEVLAIYSEDGLNNTKIFKRGYDIDVVDKVVLIADDVSTTGGSVKKTIEAARKLRAQIAGVAFLWNRGSITAEDLGVEKLISLVSKVYESFDEEKCPLCAEGIPINTQVGKGAEYLRAKARV